jgi:hypothetical protein
MSAMRAALATRIIHASKNKQKMPREFLASDSLRNNNQTFKQ